MCMSMCEDMCTDMHADMFTDLCISMCTDVYVHMYADTCVYMCIGVRVDTSVACMRGKPWEYRPCHTAHMHIHPSTRHIAMHMHHAHSGTRHIAMHTAPYTVRSRHHVLCMFAMPGPCLCLRSLFFSITGRCLFRIAGLFFITIFILCFFFSLDRCPTKVSWVRPVSPEARSQDNAHRFSSYGCSSG